MACHVAVVLDQDDSWLSVPTLDAFQALCRRVEQLEAQLQHTGDKPEVAS